MDTLQHSPREIPPLEEFCNHVSVDILIRTKTGHTGVGFFDRTTGLWDVGGIRIMLKTKDIAAWWYLPRYSDI